MAVVNWANMQPGFSTVALGVLLACCRPAFGAEKEAQNPDVVRHTAGRWRAQHRIIDLHQHVDYSPEHLTRAVRIMDRVGIGIEVNLSGGTTTHQEGKPSEFERNKRLADKLFPARFVHYMNLDYSGWDQPDFSALAVQQIEEGHRLGAAGFKQFKRLGLTLRDGAGKLLRIDDPRLDPV